MKRSPLKRKTPLKSKTGLKSKAAKPKRRVTGCCVRSCNRRGPWVDVAGVRWCIKHADEEAWRRFSWFIRDRDKRCTGAEVFPEMPCNGPLAAAHIEPRKTWPTKYDPRNVHALCNWAHHPLVDSGSKLGRKYQWAIHVVGQETFDDIMRLSLTFGDRRTIVAETLALYPPKPKNEG